MTNESIRDMFAAVKAVIEELNLDNGRSPDHCFTNLSFTDNANKNLDTVFVAMKDPLI